MFCPNCGANVADGAVFCANCGGRMGAAAPASAPAAAYSAPTGGAYSGRLFNASTWDGGVLDTFVNSLIASLIMSCTCYIATPWALCYMLKFVISHTVINGKRLKFEGDGASLFGNWIVWMILSTITCGIYSFWVIPKMYQWIVSNIHFDE